MTIGPWSPVGLLAAAAAKGLWKVLLPAYTIVGDPLTSCNPTQFKYTLDYLKKVHRTKGHGQQDLYKEKDICIPFWASRWSYSGHYCPFKMDHGLQIIKNRFPTGPTNSTKINFDILQALQNMVKYVSSCILFFALLLKAFPYDGSLVIIIIICKDGQRTTIQQLFFGM